MVDSFYAALNGFATGALSGCAIFVESADDWGFFAFFIFPSWLESVHNMLEKRQKVISVPYFKVLLSN